MFYIILSLMKILLWGERQTCTLVPSQQFFFFFHIVSPAQRKLFWHVRSQPLGQPARLLCLCSVSLLETLFLYRELKLRNLILGKARRGPNSSEATADSSKEQFTNVCPFNLFLQLLVMSRISLGLLWPIAFLSNNLKLHVSE